MKVLLVWSEIPDAIKVFALEGDDADLAIKCHNLYFNFHESEDLVKLNELLLDKTPVDSSEPVDAQSYDKVVLSGFYL